MNHDAMADCTLLCQNHGFRIQPVDQQTCSCHCPFGFKGTSCEELDTDKGCGEFITLRNGESNEIKMASYTSGNMCTWLIKAESNSLLKAIVTSIDLPYSARKECYHWIEVRDYLIGDPGKELCGNSTIPKTYTQMSIGESSPLMIRFNSRRNHTSGKGFVIRVQAFPSGCMSSPCKTGLICSGEGSGSYKCACQNGVSGTNCDEFGALSHNFCDFEDDFDTCIFDQDTSGASNILWSFNTRICGKKGQCLQGTGFQFLTMSPSLDMVPYDLGSKAIITTTVKFTGY
ncbi:inactive serine protease PAMR1-like [Saccostrea cucullata]|uniref:inactive serine protease PAMR1-like n=1 Tax=Saccostrea cuccullata TaxID=36930 RepID=UPI002ED487EF